MSQSPAKRRKLDKPQSRPVDEATQDDAQPTTPTRASYLSPTKSSLARSHPHLVPRSTRRSATEPRGKSSRDDILGGRSEPSAAPTTVARIRQSQGFDGADDSVDAQIDVPPSGTEPSHLAADLNRLQSIDHERPPLRERQPAQKSGRRERSVSSEEPLPLVFTPKLVSKKDVPPRPIDRALSGEPELPPTPVELGLIAAPERPRGLASSSSPRGSRRSKMSSESRRRRTRSSGPATSSPLKPTAAAPVQKENARRRKTRSSGPVTSTPLKTIPAAPVQTDNSDIEDDVQEALESEPEDTHQEYEEEESSELQEKRSTLQSLREQLDQLRRENQQLQEAIDDDDQINQELLSMLYESATEDHSHSLPTTFVNARDGFFSYLTFFTPANLQLKTCAETTSTEGRTKITHILQIQAPAPWLPNALSCAFDVAVDAENVQIENIELKDAMMALTRRTTTTRAEMYKWVHERLEHPLHRLDVSGMIWGMGRWFNAAVERAKVFLWIDLKYNRSPLKIGEKTDEQDSELTRKTCIELARYLDSHQNSAIDTDLTITSGGGRFRKKLMLNWQINLDWAGGLTSNIQVSTSGIPRKAEPGLKTIFCSLVPKVGVKGAFQKVWALIHSDGAEFTFEGDKAKKKRK